ncbi:hypothetical protein [Acidaminococcus fermentans]|uniref:hypothetical protein n=1 Tax=Acidaminococcus fermentans TaxID=905 RepID=UPI00241D7D46|nr:hypothetical protein [Acidaminococcus fermentans]
MDLEKEVEYRLAKWVFANIYHEGRTDESTYHWLLNRLLDECRPPMESIEERFKNEENNQED